MIVIKKEHELDAMRVAARKTATILRAVADRVAPGVTTGELDAYAAELAKEAEGRCAFYGYHGFSGHICASVNEEIVHGVPGGRMIRDGDIVSIDFGLVYDGFVGDTAITVAAGSIPQEWQQLLDVTKASLDAAIGQAVEEIGWVIFRTRFSERLKRRVSRLFEILWGMGLVVKCMKILRFLILDLQGKDRF